jgi:hypothetical protein
MLSIVQIAERIKNPASSKKEDLNHLRELTNKYPYAQLFSILYLKALSTHNDIRFEEELHQHAYRITDRAELYRLISEKETHEQFVSDENLVNTEKEIATSIDTESIFVENTSMNEFVAEEEIESEKISEVATPAPEVSSTVSTENTEPIIHISPETSSTEQVTIEPEEPIDSDEVSLELIEEEISKNDHFEKEVLSEVMASSFTLDPIAIQEDKYDDSDEIREDALSGKRSFSSWLRSNANDLPQINTDKVRIDALVDQFIQESPSIARPTKSKEQEERPKKEFYSPSKNAKQSIDESSMPVSETLAKIFALQGNYPKAIFTYEQLILSIPEKKVFFATQIEELKKKLNS